MGVDAAILIYERLHEEQALGKREDDAIYAAYDRARDAIYAGQMSTIAIGILLMMLGSDLFQ
jgi:preprotein translocase subunit SecD